MWGVSESSIKIKVKLHGALFVVLLTSAVIYKQRLLHGTSLYNIFKTANALTLARSSLESPYKVLQCSWKGIIFKQPVQFSKAVQF